MPRARVFVVHGRNIAARNALCRFMECLGLEPMTWEDAVTATKKVAPTTFEVVKKGLSDASVTVVMFTADEKAQLREKFAKNPRDEEPGFQSRPNVFFEAGLAFAIRPDQTILLCLGDVRIQAISDLAGINFVEYDNTPNKRQAFVERLETALQITGQHPKLKKSCINDSALSPDKDFDIDFKATTTNLTGLTEFTTFRRQNVFQQGMNILKQKPHQRVFIYAPTGVWEEVPLKREWFKTIAGCLAKKWGKKQPKADNTVSEMLEEFVGVYGLPPIEKDAQGSLINKADVEKHLNYMEDLLLPFNGLRNAVLYYLPNGHQIPGGGTIIIDDSMLTMAFATTHGYLADAGFTIFHETELTKDAERWFTNNVLRLAGSHVLQRLNAVDNFTVKSSMNDIRQSLGLPRRTRYP